MSSIGPRNRIIKLGHQNWIIQTVTTVCCVLFKQFFIMCLWMWIVLVKSLFSRIKSGLFNLNNNKKIILTAMKLPSCQPNLECQKWPCPSAILKIAMRRTVKRAGWFWNSFKVLLERCSLQAVVISETTNAMDVGGLHSLVCTTTAMLWFTGLLVFSKKMKKGLNWRRVLVQAGACSPIPIGARLA